MQTQAKKNRAVKIFLKISKFKIQVKSNERTKIKFKIELFFKGQNVKYQASLVFKLTQKILRNKIKNWIKKMNKESNKGKNEVMF